MNKKVFDVKVAIGLWLAAFIGYKVASFMTGTHLEWSFLPHIYSSLAVGLIAGFIFPLKKK